MSHPKHVLHDAPGHLFVYAEAFQTIRRTSKLCADAAAFRQALGFPASAATWATVAPVVRGSLSSSTIVTWSDGLQAAKRLLAAIQATGQLVEQVIAMETARMRLQCYHDRAHLQSVANGTDAQTSDASQAAPQHEPEQP
jgi:hypothetical protein